MPFDYDKKMANALMEGEEHLTNGRLKDAIISFTNVLKGDLQGHLRGPARIGRIRAFLKSNKLLLAKHDLDDFEEYSLAKGNADIKKQFQDLTKEYEDACASLDLEGLVEQLINDFDKPRVDKAIAMLKAESFQLFSNVNEERLEGIVRSQSSMDRVYSCQLNSEGHFFCTSQNLRPCGGLRGALCKHILVLVIGLTKADLIKPHATYLWAMRSKVWMKPDFDKDAATEMFIRYKGAEAGEVDWRPTETMPEDYYSL